MSPKPAPVHFTIEATTGMADRLQPILDAIVAATSAFGFAIGGTAFTVLKRKAAVRRETMDPPHMITVAKSARKEETSRRRVGLWQTTYYVDVVVHAPYDGPDGDQGAHSRIRDTLVDAFKKPPLAGAPEVFEMDAQANNWLQPSGETIEYDWWALEVAATVAHA